MIVVGVGEHCTAALSYSLLPSPSVASHMLSVGIYGNRVEGNEVKRYRNWTK